MVLSEEQSYAGNLPRLIKYDSMINYRDGSEDVLLNIVTADDFDECLTWRKYRKNWALYYHLAPHRKNIINWFDWGKEPIKILELGAGCGAITSGLVKIDESQITAVEGSLDRAKVIQHRCASANNLEIHVCNINDFKSDIKYDVVTLIGVLEYSGRYLEQDEPFLSLLSFAQNLLKEDGILFLAIENKLGHKYITGSIEDHYGRPWEGINNYPNYDGVKTFDYKELSDLLNKSGFLGHSWYYPYPDYKLPGIVISEDGISSKNFDWLPLFNIPDEPNMSETPSFNEQAFLESMNNLECANYFMNSFCIVASKNKSFNRFKQDTFLAYKSTIKHRSPNFNVETFFKKDKSNNIVVTKVSKEEENREYKYLNHVLDVAPQKYYSGYKTIHDIIMGSLYKANYKKIVKYYNIWQDILIKHSFDNKNTVDDKFNQFSNEMLGKLIYNDLKYDLWIDGKFLDLIPSNILIHPETDDYVFIDLEWQMNINVPTQLVFDRGMQILKGNILGKSRYISPKLNNISSLPEAVHQKLKDSMFIRNFDYRSVVLFDNWFQGGVFNNSIDSAIHLNDNFKNDLDVLEFMNIIVKKVEEGRHSEAIIFYDNNRHKFPKIAELEKFDNLINGIKNKL